ncbi:RAB6A-GEF complex partner protein 1 [Armadillidium vulgare]|nr:RAB6A-GEF complex partner protein 1 [Armadillidium vulgare]
MYYPIGLPKRLNICNNSDGEIQAIVCNRDRILFAILSENAIWIWFSRPCVPLTAFQRSLKSVQETGTNRLVEWRPDSSMLVVATNKNILLFYSVSMDGSHREVYEQDDSPLPSLRRYSAELYTKERIPPLKHCSTVPLEVPGTGVHVVHLEYSPLVGGFAVVFSDGRAAFLTASTLKFDPNAVQGIWARDLEDACCAAINHKYRLLAFGRANSQGVVMMVDEATGGLEVCHRLILSSKDFVGHPGPVGHMRWTPDGTVLGLSWVNGGFSLWSEWGAEGYEAWCVRGKSKSKLENQRQNSPSSSVNLPPFNPKPEDVSRSVSSLPENLFRGGEPGADSEKDDAFDGENEEDKQLKSSVIIMTFIKSALTVNPCMSRLERVLLQGSDRLYLSSKEGLETESVDEMELFSESSPYFYGQEEDEESLSYEGPGLSHQRSHKVNTLNVAASKQWLVVPIPYSYTAANWPIRYTCIDDEGEYIGVAGRNGVAHYSLKKRKWRLFGNENQEEDLVVTGGTPMVLLLNIYCDQMIVLTSDCRITVYNLSEHSTSAKANSHTVSVSRIQEVDISGLTVHPACVISVGLTSLRTESWRSHCNHPVRPPAQSIIFNISGKVLMIQRDHSIDPSASSESVKDQKLVGFLVLSTVLYLFIIFIIVFSSWFLDKDISFEYLIVIITFQFQSAQMTPIVLASCCEALWCATRTVSHKPHLSHALWLHCGAHGTRAWLPLFPAPGVDRGHTFMARRIMLPFTPSIYPLAVLFEEAIMIGAETDSSILACDNTTLHQPLVLVEKTSQVYLHHLLRQLLRRNLGYHAWEVANTCRHLPYFPHALELLLHQVLEEEATSKDPIPDSLLPRVLDFIREFPVHLLTVVQCARKTELALWRYLFSVAGSPRHLFTQALSKGELETAASYLIILQNLESAMVSRTHATKLLDATLEASKWELSKDLIRFLRSIDPKDLESPKASAPISIGTRIGFTHATPPVSPQCADEDLSMIMPNTQALRGRSFSSASGPKAPGAPGGNFDGAASSTSFPHVSASRTVSDTSKGKGSSPGASSVKEPRKTSSGSSKDLSTAEEYFLDVILQRRAKKLLTDRRLRDLGTMAAHLDFPLVSWLRKEKLRAASVDDFVLTLRQVHQDFSWPFPISPNNLLRKYSVSSSVETSEGTRMSSIEERMQQLSITVPKGSSLNGGEIGDSGYLSQSTNTGDTGTPLTPQHLMHSHSITPLPLSNTVIDGTVTHEAMLAPHSPTAADMFSMSEEGSLFGDDTGSIACGGEWGPEGTIDPTRNLLSRSPDPPLQPHPKPPPYAEVQLRYLLQIFLEAGCLEISVVLAVVLRDALAILRVVSLARSPDIPAQVLTRLANGLKQMKHFTDTHLGYQSFMSAVMSQTKVLQRLAENRHGASNRLANTSASSWQGSGAPKIGSYQTSNSNMVTQVGSGGRAPSDGSTLNKTSSGTNSSSLKDTLTVTDGSYGQKTDKTSLKDSLGAVERKHAVQHNDIKSSEDGATTSMARVSVEEDTASNACILS